MFFFIICIQKFGDRCLNGEGVFIFRFCQKGGGVDIWTEVGTSTANYGKKWRKECGQPEWQLS